MHNWLVKLCSEQPTQDASVEQQLEQLTINEIREAAQPQPTAALDALQEKMASADQMGRELAHEQGAGPSQEAQYAALQQQDIAKAISELPDDEAIKVAYVLEHGSEQEKTAFLGAIKGLVGGAAKKVMQSGAGKKAVGWASKNPLQAAGAAGAGAGALMGGEGNRLGGALGGAALGAGGGALAGRGAIRGALSKFAMRDQPNEWLQQFEGTPLLQTALGLERQLLEAEQSDIEQRAADKQQRAQERAQESDRDSLWDTKDRLDMEKKMLELQLIGHRNGVSEQGGEQPGAEDPMAAQQPDPAAAEQAQQPNLAEAAAASQPGQGAVEAIKQAMSGATRAAMRAAGIGARQTGTPATQAALKSVRGMSTGPVAKRLSSAKIPGKAPGSTFTLGKAAMTGASGAALRAAGLGAAARPVSRMGAALGKAKGVATQARGGLYDKLDKSKGFLGRTTDKQRDIALGAAGVGAAGLGAASMAKRASVVFPT